MKTDEVIKNTTCFDAHLKYGANCERSTCKNWFKNKKAHNCVILCAQEGSKTLEEIGEIYDLTRMRICQIEKNIYKKLRVLIND